MKPWIDDDHAIGGQVGDYASRRTGFTNDER